MATQFVMRPCAKCERKTIQIGPSTSHVLHLFLSLITFGIWLIVWLSIIFKNHWAFSECTECGTQTTIFGTTVGPIRKYLLLILICLPIIFGILYNISSFLFDVIKIYFY